MSWCVYLIEAKNGNIYTGITNDLKARISKHVNGTGAKFFRTSAPKRLLMVEELPDKSACLKREIEIKKLGATKKKELAKASAFQPIGIKKFLS